MSRPQPRHDQPLLGLGGRGLFDDLLDFVEPLLPRHPPAAYGPVIRQHVLPRRLHRRHRARLALRHLDKLLGARSSERLIDR